MALQNVAGSTWGCSLHPEVGAGRKNALVDLPCHDFEASQGVTLQANITRWAPAMLGSVAEGDCPPTAAPALLRATTGQRRQGQANGAFGEGGGVLLKLTAIV